jgi:hypothetical protein
VFAPDNPRSDQSLQSFPTEAVARMNALCRNRRHKKIPVHSAVAPQSNPNISQFVTVAVVF